MKLYVRKKNTNMANILLFGNLIKTHIKIIVGLVPDGHNKANHMNFLVSHFI